MALNVSAWSIRQPLPSIVMMAAIVAIGYVSFKKMPITRMPADLPRTIDEPMVQRYDIAGLPILTYAAIAPGKTPEQISWFVEDVVIRRLQGIRGVASVDRIGGVEREIRVGLNPVAL